MSLPTFNAGLLRPTDSARFVNIGPLVSNPSILGGSPPSYIMSQSEAAGYGWDTAQGLAFVADNWSYNTAEARGCLGPLPAAGFAMRTTVVQPDDHFVAGQCVVPYGGFPGAYPAVRVNRAADRGYYMTNAVNSGGYMSWTLFRRVGGVETAIGAWWASDVPGNGAEMLDSYVKINGVFTADNHWCIIECATLADGVHLRCSIGVQWDGTDQITHATYPNMVGDFPDPALMKLSPTTYNTWTFPEVVDTSASRILTGQPGLMATGFHAEGSLANLHAGPLPFMIKFVSPTSGALAGGATVRLTHNGGQ